VGFKLYKAKVPGSLMLFGEHAVLYGSSAIVSALDRYITVTLIPRADQIINIDSSLLGNYRFNLSDFTIKSPWQLVLTALATQIDRFSSGFDLIIEADFSDQIGFGSSAALTVAVLIVLSEWLNSDFDQLMLIRTAREVIQKVQGPGSGADVAASVFGGTIAYQMNPLVVKPLLYKLPLVAVYSGHKVSTKEVIQKVAAARAKHQAIFTSLFSTIEKITSKAIQAINHQDWQFLGELMNIHQGVQVAMGVSNAILSELIFALRQSQNIYGAKISGSGLGDCVIGLGTLTTNYFPQNAYQEQLGVKQFLISH
jgi:mevalonate kinase